MNALNILSGISATPPPSPSRSRTSSAGNINDVRRSSNDRDPAILGAGFASTELNRDHDDEPTPTISSDATVDEKDPLIPANLANTSSFTREKWSSRLWRIPKQIADAVVASIKVVLTTIVAPARYVVSCFCDDQGRLSVMVPVRSMFRLRRRRSYAPQPTSGRGGEGEESYHEKPRLRPKEDGGSHSETNTRKRRSASADSDTTSQSHSDSEKQAQPEADDSPARNTRSKTASKKDDGTAPAKRSIRIKLDNEEALKRKRRQPKATNSTDSQEDKVAAVASSLKSPSSPASTTKLKYPRAPAAPRPLVPRRQPSYTFTHSADTPKKTLIIDLDETLIHSMAKGGRMSTGHMVEVKFQGSIGGSGMVLGPQVPILYYVHERPFCHEFLRKVSSALQYMDGPRHG